MPENITPKFTPGSWGRARHGEIVTADMRHPRRIAQVQPIGKNNMLGTEGEANARLIAAAPDMFEMLLIARDEYHHLYFQEGKDYLKHLEAVERVLLALV